MEFIHFEANDSEQDLLDNCEEQDFFLKLMNLLTMRVFKEEAAHSQLFTGLLTRPATSAML